MESVGTPHALCNPAVTAIMGGDVGVGKKKEVIDNVPIVILGRLYERFVGIYPFPAFHNDFILFFEKMYRPPFRRVWEGLRF
jgi:hypothetical protein